MSLQDEIKQTKPFKSISEELYLSIIYTAEKIKHSTECTFKQFGLTSTQYNILRILRGAGDLGRTCGEISERMISKIPDITRLIDRMEKKALVKRERSETDRRVVKVFILNDGLNLLDTCEPHIKKVNTTLFSHLSTEEQNVTIQTLTKIRDQLNS